MSKKNKAEKEFTYVSIECCLIPHLKEDVDAILSYGIVKYSQNKKLGIEEIVVEAIRLFYNGKLPHWLETVFNNAFENLMAEESFRGYNHKGNYDPRHELSAISRYFLSQKDAVAAHEEFVNDCRKYCQINRALHDLKISAPKYLNTLSDYKNIKRIVDAHEARHGKDALVMIKTDMLFDFRDNEKSHHDFELLRGFLAIKSIQGQKDFAVTNKPFIIARMIGAKNLDIAKALIREKATKKEYERYSERYFFDKMITELQLKSFIMGKITYGRSMYLSTQLDNTLLCSAIMNHTENKQIKAGGNLLKQQEKELRSKIANNLKTSNLQQ